MLKGPLWRRPLGRAVPSQLIWECLLRPRLADQWDFVRFAEERKLGLDFDRSSTPLNWRCERTGSDARRSVTTDRNVGARPGRCRAVLPVAVLASGRRKRLATRKRLGSGRAAFRGVTPHQSRLTPARTSAGAAAVRNRQAQVIAPRVIGTSSPARNPARPAERTARRRPAVADISVAPAGRLEKIAVGRKKTQESASEPEA